MNAIKKVKMVFEKVNYRVLNDRMVKETAILADYDILLCDLMQECLKKGNYLTLQNIVTLVRKTCWHTANHSERIADLAEGLMADVTILTNDKQAVLPSYEKMRVQRVLTAIQQAIGYQAKQWQNALPFNNGKESLQALYDDLFEMEDYFLALTTLQHDFDSADIHGSYTSMRIDAFDMLSRAKTAVWAKMHKDDEKEGTLADGE